MKTEITNISLSFCCKEDWNSFKSMDERSKFCGSCKHRVIDFTTATAHDLALAQKQGERICGRFTRSQLSTTFLNSLAAVTIASTILSSCNDPVSIVPTDPQPVLSDDEITSGEFTTIGIIALPRASCQVSGDTTETFTIIEAE